MKKLTLILTVTATTIIGSIISSCGCCTGGSTAPVLRPEPVFKPIESPVIFQK